MLDYIEYTKENGKDSGHDLVVYALSTCGFCKRALTYLREKGLSFQYVYVDQLQYEVKQKVKEDLQKKFEKRVVFPYLVYDDKDVLVGFVKDEWDKSLNS